MIKTLCNVEFYIVTFNNSVVLNVVIESSKKMNRTDFITRLSLSDGIVAISKGGSVWCGVARGQVGEIILWVSAVAF